MEKPFVHSLLPWSCNSLQSLGYNFTYLASINFTGSKIAQGLKKHINNLFP